MYQCYRKIAPRKSACGNPLKQYSSTLINPTPEAATNPSRWYTPEISPAEHGPPDKTTMSPEDPRMSLLFCCPETAIVISPIWMNGAYAPDAHVPEGSTPIAGKHPDTELLATRSVPLQQQTATGPAMVPEQDSPSVRVVWSGSGCVCIGFVPEIGRAHV
jgi:hypothetical protein